MSKKITKVLLIIFFLLVPFEIFYVGFTQGRKDEQQQVSKVEKTIKIIKDLYIKELSQEEMDKLYDAAIDAMVKKLDRHSRFIKSQESSAELPTLPIIKIKILSDNIGYIKIPNFSYGIIYEEVKAAINVFNKENTKGLIIDLRNNLGGDTETTIKLLDLFLKKDLEIVAIEFRHSLLMARRTETKAKYNKPIVILINNKSASASEVFSGVLQYHGRAVLIGTKTYGKGVGQSVFTFRDGSTLVITTAKYYLPDGKCPHGVGITPDIIIKDSKEQLREAIRLLEKLKITKNSPEL